MDKSTHASEVLVNSAEQTLTIVWADGHRSVFPFGGLRRACPCVECVGGHANMGQPVDPAIFKQPATRTWKIVDLQEVGNYAMQIFWDDGHNTGIYRWDSLRAMCPCEKCQPQ